MQDQKKYQSFQLVRFPVVFVVVEKEAISKISVYAEYVSES